MVKMRATWRILGVAVVLSLVAAACGGDDETSDGGATDGGSEPTSLTGSVNISGSSTVEPISALVAELFNESNPDVQIRVDGPGTGDGFELFCAGDTDISDASRPIDEEEAAALRGERHRVHRARGRDRRDRRVDQPGERRRLLPEPGRSVRAVRSESEGFTSWSDANDLAAAVGGTGSFPDASARDHRAG